MAQKQSIQLYSTKTEDLADRTCLSFMICMNLNFFLGLSELGSFNTIKIFEIALMTAGIALVPLRVILTHSRIYRLKELLAIMIMLFIGGITFSFSGAPTFLKLILFWLGCRGSEQKKLLRYEIISLLISLLIILIPALVGVSNMRYWYDSSMFVFGFKNPNSLPAAVTAILISYCMIQGNSLSLKSIFMQIAFTILILYLTSSRSAVITLLLFYMLLLLCRLSFFRRAIRFLTPLFTGVFIILGAVSYYLAANYSYGSLIWDSINRITTWRLYLWNRYFVASRLTLFGERVTGMGTLDNAYLMLLLRYGIVIFAVYVVLFHYVVKQSRKNNDLIAAIAVLCYEVYFLVEYTPLLINVNPLLLMAISNFSTIQQRQEKG